MKTQAVKKPKKEKGVSLSYAKKNMKWAVIPLSKLPDDTLVIGIQQYPSKDFAKFHLVKEVIVPVFRDVVEAKDVLAKYIITFPSDGDMNDETIKRNIIKAMEEYANQYK